MQEKPSSSEKIFNLDNQANKLGMGGKLSPDIDESSYKKRKGKYFCRKKVIILKAIRQSTE